MGRRGVSRPVSRVLSDDPKAVVATIPLGRALRRASSNPPERRTRRRLAVSRRVVPIRSCSRWGLPCRSRCRSRGGLLPHRFTLTRERHRCAARREADPRAVCSLWHCPWGRPRRALPGTVSPWSPDFPPPPPFGVWRGRSPGRLTGRTFRRGHGRCQATTEAGAAAGRYRIVLRSGERRTIRCRQKLAM